VQEDHAMSLVKLVNLAARITLVLGVLRLLVGLYVASIDDPAERAKATARYLGSGTSGDQINSTIVVIVVAVFALLLSKIATKKAK
jgi:hypothetical protein